MNTQQNTARIPRPSKFTAEPRDVVVGQTLGSVFYRACAEAAAERAATDALLAVAFADSRAQHGRLTFALPDAEWEA